NRWAIIGKPGGDDTTVRLIDETFVSTDTLILNGSTSAAIVGNSIGCWAGQSAVASSNLAAISNVNNEMHHVGVKELQTGSTIGDTSALFLARDSASPSEAEPTIDADHLRYFCIWIR